MKLQDLINKIERKFPRFLAESWDNVGLMIGDRNQDIQTILVALEINEEVVEEAISKKADLIFTHHPFFFTKFNQITSDSVKGALTLRLIMNGIAVYSAHTNYDIAFDGMNDSFIKRIGYRTEEVFLKSTSCEEWYQNEHDHQTPGLGRIFTLKEAVTLAQFTSMLKNTLNMNYIRFVGDGNFLVQRIAVITGAAADMYADAKAVGADVLISGDMKYHIAHDALDLGMNVIDCGHFETENLFRDSMKEFLSSICSLTILSSTTNLNPFQVI